MSNEPTRTGSPEQNEDVKRTTAQASSDAAYEDPLERARHLNQLKDTAEELVLND